MQTHTQAYREKEKVNQTTGAYTHSALEMLIKYRNDAVNNQVSMTIL